MTSLAELKNMSRVVKRHLIDDPMCRESDRYLYYKICEEILNAHGLDIRSISLHDGLLYNNDFGLPPFETVRRTRQKMQAQFPALASNDEVQGFKDAQEETFREYARE